MSYLVFLSTPRGTTCFLARRTLILRYCTVPLAPANVDVSRASGRREGEHLVVREIKEKVNGLRSVACCQFALFLAWVRCGGPCRLLSVVCKVFCAVITVQPWALLLLFCCVLLYLAKSCLLPPLTSLIVFFRISDADFAHAVGAFRHGKWKFLFNVCCLGYYDPNSYLSSPKVGTALPLDNRFEREPSRSCLDQPNTN